MHHFRENAEYEFEIRKKIFNRLGGSLALVFGMESSKSKENMNFKCEICEKHFSTNSTKNEHISTIHGRVKKFVCNICSKNFGRQS